MKDRGGIPKVGILEEGPPCPAANALCDPIGPSEIDVSCVFWIHLERVPRLVLGLFLAWSPRVSKESPKGSKRIPWEVILRLRGEYVPKVVSPLYEEGPPQRRRRSGFGSTPEIWPHAKIDDSCVFWTHFALLEKDFFGIFGVCI